MGFLEILILVLMLGYNALVHWTISWLPVAYPYCNMWLDGTLELLHLSVHESVHLLMCGWGHGDVLGKSGLGSSKNLDSCLNTLSKKGRKMKGIDWLSNPLFTFLGSFLSKIFQLWKTDSSSISELHVSLPVSPQPVHRVILWIFLSSPAMTWWP